MPGLARLIEFNKEKSYIFQELLLAEDGPCRAVKPEHGYCSVISDKVGQLRPHQLRREHLPQALEELQEIRRATEQSVDLIMGKAEVLMEQEANMDDAVSILEACSFQDLVGQRISKVTELLKSLEMRFEGLLNEIGVEDNFDAVDDDELDAERRRKELILHGPQSGDEGVSQDDIDALLGA